MKPPVGSRVMSEGKSGTVTAHRPGSMVDVRWDDKDYDMRTDASSLRLVRTNGKPKTPVFVAAVLDDAAKQVLYNYWISQPGAPAPFPVMKMSHMTIKFRPSLEETAALPIGQPVQLRIAGWAGDDKIQAVAVEPVGVGSANAVPHVTFALADASVPPKLSNDLFTNANALGRRTPGPVITARLGWSDGGTYHFEQPQVAGNPGPRGGLTESERDALPTGEFALPGRRFPINDRRHALLAMQYILRGFVHEGDQHQVLRAIGKKYPRSDARNAEIWAFYEKHKQRLEQPRTAAAAKKAKRAKIAANPKGDVYDPAKEQFRAVVQGVYESLVRKQKGTAYNAQFDLPGGKRLDDGLDPALKRQLLSRAYAIATRQGQKYGWLQPGTQTPTERGRSAAQQRLIDVKHAEENRQDYERTLSAVRRSTPFRVVEEVVDGRSVFVVQPRPPETVKIPKYRLSRDAAEADAAEAARSFRVNPYYVHDAGLHLDSYDIPDEPAEAFVEKDESFEALAKRLQLTPEMLFDYGEVERPLPDPDTGKMTYEVMAPGRLQKALVPSRKQKRSVEDKKATREARDAYEVARIQRLAQIRSGIPESQLPPPTPPGKVYREIEVTTAQRLRRDAEAGFDPQDAIDAALTGYRVPKSQTIRRFESGFTVEDMNAPVGSPGRIYNLRTRETERQREAMIGKVGTTWAEYQKATGISDEQLNRLWTVATPTSVEPIPLPTALVQTGRQLVKLAALPALLRYQRFGERYPQESDQEWEQERVDNWYREFKLHPKDAERKPHLVPQHMAPKAFMTSTSQFLPVSMMGLVVPFPGVDPKAWWSANGEDFIEGVWVLFKLLAGVSLTKEESKNFSLNLGGGEILSIQDFQEETPTAHERVKALRIRLSQLRIPAGLADVLFDGPAGLAALTYRPGFSYLGLQHALAQLINAYANMLSGGLQSKSSPDYERVVAPIWGHYRAQVGVAVPSVVIEIPEFTFRDGKVVKIPNVDAVENQRFVEAALAISEDLGSPTRDPLSFSQVIGKDMRGVKSLTSFFDARVEYIDALEGVEPGSRVNLGKSAVISVTLEPTFADGATALSPNQKSTADNLAAQVRAAQGKKARAVALSLPVPEHLLKKIETYKVQEQVPQSRMLKKFQTKAEQQAYLAKRRPEIEQYKATLSQQLEESYRNAIANEEKRRAAALAAEAARRAEAAASIPAIEQEFKGAVARYKAIAANIAAAAPGASIAKGPQARGGGTEYDAKQTATELERRLFDAYTAAGLPLPQPVFISPPVAPTPAPAPEQERVQYFDEERVGQLMDEIRAYEREYLRAMEAQRGKGPVGTLEREEAQREEAEDELIEAAGVGRVEGEVASRELTGETVEIRRIVDMLKFKERQLLDELGQGQSVYRPRFLTAAEYSRPYTPPAQVTEQEQLLRARSIMIEKQLKRILDWGFHPEQGELTAYIRNNRSLLEGDKLVPARDVLAIFPPDGRSPISYLKIDTVLEPAEVAALRRREVIPPQFKPTAEQIGPTLLPVPAALTSGEDGQRHLPWLVILAALRAGDLTLRSLTPDNALRLRAEKLIKEAPLNSLAARHALRAAAQAFERQNAQKARKMFPKLYASLDQPEVRIEPFMVAFKELGDLRATVSPQNPDAVQTLIANLVRQAAQDAAQKVGGLAKMPYTTLTQRKGAEYIWDRPTAAALLVTPEARRSDVERSVLRTIPVPESPVAKKYKGAGAEQFEKMLNSVTNVIASAYVTGDSLGWLESWMKGGSDNTLTRADEQPSPDKAAWAGTKEAIAKQLQAIPEPFSNSRTSELFLTWRGLVERLAALIDAGLPVIAHERTVEGFNNGKPFYEQKPDISKRPRVGGADLIATLAGNPGDMAGLGRLMQAVQDVNFLSGLSLGDEQKAAISQNMAEIYTVLRAVAEEAAARLTQKPSSRAPEGPSDVVAASPESQMLDERIKEIRRELTRVQQLSPRMPPTEDKPPAAFWDVVWDEQSPTKEAYILYVDKTRYRFAQLEKEISGQVKVYDTETNRVVGRPGPDTSGVEAGPTSEEAQLMASKQEAEELGDTAKLKIINKRLGQFKRDRKRHRSRVGSAPFLSPYRVVGFANPVPIIQRRLAKFASPQAKQFYAKSAASEQVASVKGKSTVSAQQLTSGDIRSGRTQADVSAPGERRMLDPRFGWVPDPRWASIQQTAQRQRAGSGGSEKQYFGFSLSNYEAFKTFNPQVAAATILYWDTPELVTGAVIDLPHGKTLVTPSAWTTAGVQASELEVLRVLPFNVRDHIMEEIDLARWEAEEAAILGDTEKVNRITDVLFGITLPGGGRVPGLIESLNKITTRAGGALPSRANVTGLGGNSMYGRRLSIEGAPRISLYGAAPTERQAYLRAAQDTVLMRLLTNNNIAEIQEARQSGRRRAEKYAEAMKSLQTAIQTRFRALSSAQIQELKDDPALNITDEYIAELNKMTDEQRKWALVRVGDAMAAYIRLGQTLATSQDERLLRLMAVPAGSTILYVSRLDPTGSNNLHHALLVRVDDTPAGLRWRVQRKDGQSETIDPLRSNVSVEFVAPEQVVRETPEAAATPAQIMEALGGIDAMSGAYKFAERIKVKAAQAEQAAERAAERQEAMPLLRQAPNITRNAVRENRDVLFVFGDNMKRKGMGGQAAEMRGEPNAVGIPTKRAPAMNADAFFTDADLPAVQPAIDEAFDRLEAHIRRGGVVMWPLDGIGTGRAKLSQVAPAVANYIQDRYWQLQQVAREEEMQRAGVASNPFVKGTRNFNTPMGRATLNRNGANRNRIYNSSRLMPLVFE